MLSASLNRLPPFNETRLKKRKHRVMELGATVLADISKSSFVDHKTEEEAEYELEGEVEEKKISVLISTVVGYYMFVCM